MVMVRIVWLYPNGRVVRCHGRWPDAASAERYMQRVHPARSFMLEPI